MSRDGESCTVARGAPRRESARARWTWRRQPPVSAVFAKLADIVSVVRLFMRLSCPDSGRVRYAGTQKTRPKCAAPQKARVLARRARARRAKTKIAVRAPCLATCVWTLVYLCYLRYSGPDPAPPSPTARATHTFRDSRRRVGVYKFKYKAKAITYKWDGA